MPSLKHYLLHSSLEFNQTAYPLGYEDATSFFGLFTGGREPHQVDGGPQMLIAAPRTTHRLRLRNLNRRIHR